MPVRDTGTGRILEEMALLALQRGGYSIGRHVAVGTRPGGSRHVVDLVASRDDRRVLISLKWQQVPGTAEQKIPFEIISLADAVVTGPWDGAYIVLGGEGWTLRDYFTGGAMRRHLVYADRVKVVTLESFIALSNRGEL